MKNKELTFTEKNKKKGLFSKVVAGIVALGIGGSIVSCSINNNKDKKEEVTTSTTMSEETTTTKKVEETTEIKEETTTKEETTEIKEENIVYNELTEGVINNNLYQLEQDITNVYNSIDKDKRELFYANGIEDYTNNLKNMMLVLNGYKANIEENEIYNIQSDLNLRLSNLASMLYVEAYNGKSSVEEFNFSDLFVPGTNEHTVIKALEKDINKFISGGEAGYLLENIEVLLQGYTGVYKENYIVENNNCIPVLNENYKEENIVTLKGLDLPCNKDYKVDLSKLSDGANLTIAAMITASKFGTINLKEGQTFDSVTKEVMDSSYILNSTAYQNILNNYDNYKEYEGIKIYPETDELLGYVQEIDNNLRNDNISNDQRIGYMSDMYEILKRTLYTLPEIFVMKEGECNIVQNDLYCPNGAIISYNKNDAISTVLTQKQTRYVSVYELLEVNQIIDELLEDGYIKENDTFEITLKNNKKTITIETLKDLIFTGYNSLINSTLENKDEIQKTLKK